MSKFIVIVVNDILFWIEENLHRPLTASEIAKKSGFSEFYFQHCFKELCGISLATYLRMRKMTVAGNLLKQSTLAISEIGLLVGFDEISSFNRAFRRHYGTSPGKYRIYWEHYVKKEVYPVRGLVEKNEILLN
ncbi:TPA: helix-turn-helix transcriptional regulator [Klebsiella variicola subsp. variicola]|nr:helix-turn-helix transcriptional regulator [Klebsiella variicola subsp. variicola]